MEYLNDAKLDLDKYSHDYCLDFSINYMEIRFKSKLTFFYLSYTGFIQYLLIPEGKPGRMYLHTLEPNEIRKASA